MNWNAPRFLGAWVCVLLLGACSSHVQGPKIRQALVDRNYPQALEYVEKVDQGSSKLLYLYEKGLILHYQNEYAASNEVLEEAELLLEDLYTKSVSRELAALAVTDNIAKYRGDPYEAVLVNYYKILNYLHLGDIEGALVECRRVNEKLQLVIDEEESTFRNDPFVQYLTAMVYDAAGEYNSADVSYRVALAAYDELGSEVGVTAPDYLYCDAARLARRFGDRAQEEEILAHGVECEALPDGAGTLNLFFECGYVPHKVEKQAIIPIYKNDKKDKDDLGPVLVDRYGRERRTDLALDYVLKIAVPELVPTPVGFDYAVITAEVDTVSGQAVASTRTVLVENVATYAHKAFEDELGKILLRTIVRALGKYAAQQKAKSENTALGVFVNVLNIATESADTRNWSTLPEKILMGRLALEPGVYNLRVELFARGGAKTDTFTIPDVRIDEGRTAFVNYRIY